jgi:hypothetical protein
MQSQPSNLLPPAALVCRLHSHLHILDRRVALVQSFVHGAHLVFDLTHARGAALRLVLQHVLWVRVRT